MNTTRRTLTPEQAKPGRRNPRKRPRPGRPTTSQRPDLVSRGPASGRILGPIVGRPKRRETAR